jgi:hypothetical protein
VFAAIVPACVALCLERAGVSRPARVAALAAAALSPPLVLWSCTTLGDTWAMVAVWTSLPVVLAFVRGGDRPLAGVATGLAVALPAVVKLQLAFWSLGLLSVCLWLHRRNVRFAVAMISGAVAAALGVGLLDTVTLGRPFGSMIAQITTGREIARDFGVHPASAYARWLLEDHGAAFFVVLALLAVWAASGERRKRLLALLRDARVTLAVVIVPAVCFVLALLAIEHKELRYLVPVLPALYFVLGLLIDPVLGAMRLPRLPHAAAVLLVVVPAAASYARAMATPLLMTKYDLSRKSSRARRVRAGATRVSARTASRCSHALAEIRRASVGSPACARR